MLLQPDQPQVRLLIIFLLRGGAQLLFLLVLHPPRQPDDRQGEGLLLHALWQLLQEHHHVWQLRQQHPVLELSSVFWYRSSVFWNCSNCSRQCCDIILPAASVTEWASTKGLNMPCCSGTAHHVIERLCFNSGTTTQYSRTFCVLELLLTF